MRTTLALSLLLAASLLSAQQVRPTALKFEAVPPNTAPKESIIFTNTGTSPLTLTISVSGPPFAIAENRCANGVKPGTHCNVYLTYSPVNIGDSDLGTVTFNYGNGSTSGHLAGNGVSAIPTTVKLSSPKCEFINLGGYFSMLAKIWVDDKFYAQDPPAGEQVHTTCTNGQENADLGPATLTLCKGHGCPSGTHAVASFGFVPTQVGTWTCHTTYDGNGVLAGGTADVQRQIVDGGGHCH